MSAGFRNRLITWSGRGVPFNPERTNLLEATRRVEAVLASGARLAIAPEGRIHVGERALLPVNEGVAFFALRAGVRSSHRVHRDRLAAPGQDDPGPRGRPDRAGRPADS